MERKDGQYSNSPEAAHFLDARKESYVGGLLEMANARGGALIVYDAMIDDERNSNVFGLLMSLNMLIETAGGFDYTAVACQGWMEEAGFASSRHEALAGPHSMVVGFK